MRKRNYLLSVLVFTIISVGAFGAVLVANYKPVLGLDLQGGVSIVYKPTKAATTSTLNQTISIIRNRADGLGVAEPNIQLQGQNIVVQLPGIKNTQSALKIIGQTAQLQFRIVECGSTSSLPAYVKPPKGTVLTPADMVVACPTTQAAYDALRYVPDSKLGSFTPSSTIIETEKVNGKSYRLILSKAVMLGNSLASAYAGLNSSQQWVVNFTLTKSGSPLFDQIATTYYQQQLAVVLDNKIISAPTINSKSFGGQGTISGVGGQAGADSLALVLKYGALPVQLSQQTVQTVSATLGKSSLLAGIYAGVGGLLLVMLYTIIYYRALGVVVVLGLATTAAGLWGIVALLGHTASLTLDLSGVTGLIVSIGVTVDSYIVFFERLKDEVRAGRSIRSSVDRGFAKAFRTIVAADLVSLIGAVLLYLLSIGPVRGFAFFLGLSTFLDVISAWFFTRPLVILLGQSRLFTEAKWFGVSRGLGVVSSPRVATGGVLKPSGSKVPG